MARIERYDNPSTLPPNIEELIAAGDRPIIQFSKPASDAVLKDVNALCERHGDALDIRFYGFGSSAFDCRALRKVPAVSALEINCLPDITHVEELQQLGNLRALSLGIDRWDPSTILASPNLVRLRRLSVCAKVNGALDLSPVAKMNELVELAVVGDATSIDAVVGCANLERLRLVRLGRRVGLHFVRRLSRLRSLQLLLGGRDNLDDAAHPSLSELEIVRVRGFAEVHPAIFPNLERLQIEDQLQVESIEFGPENAKLASVRIFNCKRLRRLGGLRHLSSLQELRVSRTALDVDELLGAPLPRSLRVFAFFSGRTHADAAVRARLGGLGYAER
jgi:hypothetical protein